MVNIMLVDDDPIVLVELKSMIEWDALGCTLSAEVNSGRAAMEKLKEHKPDIVFTDISMPLVSGVELINHIHEMDDRIKVVALSAYEDFDYVRGSLKNGAKDYLLKHRISKGSLNGLIKTLIQEIGEEQALRFPSRVEESKAELLYRIVNEYAGIENPAALLARLKLEWLNDDSLLAIGGIDSRFGEGADYGTDELTIRFMIDETIKYYRDYFILSPEPGLFLLVFGVKERSRADIDEVIKQIQATLSRFFGLGMSFSVSGRFRGIEAIHPQRQMNRTILLERYARGDRSFIVHKGGSQPHSQHSLSEKAMQYITDNYKEKVTLRDIAKALFVSTSYLSRMFKKSTGINLVAYINQVKMKHARELMLHRKLSLQEIANEIGIQNYNYFYILFKETYGISPSDYIKRLDEEDGRNRTK